MSGALPLIRLTGVHAGYHGREVLRGIDLSLAPGERLALLGANGAGKSTLMHVINGFVPAKAGTIEAFGAPRREEKDFREVRARAGLVFQDPDDQLFSPTVLEDVAFGPMNLGQSRAQARATAQTTLAQLGLTGFDDRITHRLSGGEKRLIAIAAVLAMKPDVLLLDEPTAGLDPDAYDRLCAMLGKLPQAMIIAAHDAEFIARLATSAVLVRDGVCHRGTIHAHEHRRSHAHLHFEHEPAGHHHTPETEPVWDIGSTG
ncbi:energy-coupling factor ABC transporter ATP-binding protein [Mesorhizobium australicum]|jgi:cobalt/nickel transport system ATP-binding protein|uniref:Cobalt/nickel transport system ATP-binding protein n=1 Tax=Mesorhizobium australicum TaxID=536018 RepID=A0A1X7MQS5_9HYPH|nr:ABC transporter ATP-binding protein [Mesorhizobium australicum]SMH26323.1 cobalt/nickel transport system ATP-binding protein [Mesorhizobium australicum]SMH26447.1 cobalt/nickel transport system ATP-binding protein [Mesorhizobium australicum]